MTMQDAGENHHFASIFTDVSLCELVQCKLTNGLRRTVLHESYVSLELESSAQSEASEGVGVHTF